MDEEDDEYIPTEEDDDCGDDEAFYTQHVSIF